MDQQRGVIKDSGTIWTGTQSGWGLGDKDIFRIEDLLGKLIAR